MMADILFSSTTLENWIREFNKFAPSIKVQSYYANKADRPMLRQTLLETQGSKEEGGWEVLIATYALASQGDEKDRKFFRKIGWNVRTLLSCYNRVLTVMPSAACSTRAMRSRTTKASATRPCSSSKPDGACFSPALLCRTIFRNLSYVLCSV
jgi:SNF2 family DNA or RNA helicase